MPLSRLSRRLAPSPGGEGVPGPDWPMVLLIISAVALLVSLSVLSGLLQSSASPAGAPAPSAGPMSAHSGPQPTPTPVPQPDWALPLPESEAAGEDWFQDAVFLGDSRAEGLHMFSGITGADFITSTGLTTYLVAEDRPLIRVGADKISPLEALAQKQYGKVYLVLGINELGYADPEDFGQTLATVLDRIRDCQPNALLYVQTILPVNGVKCRVNKQPAFVTNENIAAYNEALSATTARKQVFRLDIPPGLADETGEIYLDLSSDGVHFKQEGYQVWLAYLLTHTGSQYLPLALT